MWRLFLDDLETHGEFTSNEEWENYLKWWAFNVMADKDSVVNYYGKISFEEANELLK